MSNLQVANNLPVVSQSQCLKKLPNVTKDGTQFCAGEKGKYSFVKLHILKSSKKYAMIKALIHVMGILVELSLIVEDLADPGTNLELSAMEVQNVVMEYQEYIPKCQVTWIG